MGAFSQVSITTMIVVIPAYKTAIWYLFTPDYSYISLSNKHLLLLLRTLDRDSLLCNIRY